MRTTSKPATAAAAGSDRDGCVPPPSLRIVAADADPDARDFYRTSLTALGHQVCLADTGRHLLDLVRAAPPEVVIADARLPDVGGFELAAEVCREWPVPVVLASADPDSGAAWGAADCPVAGFVAKPLCRKALGMAVALAVRSFERVRALGGEVERLRQALEERKVIERAKGAVMRYAGASEGEAFERMRKLSTVRNQKMAEVARLVLAAGEVFDLLAADGDGPRPARTRANGFASAPRGEP